MLKAFKHHIINKKLFTNNDKLLVAVSGGIDSMVLCHLLLQSGFSFSVAHCNFKLRGKEADDDEKFVTEFCQQHHLTLYKKDFNTTKFAEDNKISIQMAARELRYAFFENLRGTHKLNYIITAHHLNDNIETLFINLLRGTGINGLKGITEKQGNIIRPLLPHTKEEILEFAKKNNFQYREDSSNTQEKYLRNYLRLNIIPQFKQLNPSFEKTIQKELELMQQYHHIIQSHFSEEIKQAVIKTPTGIKIKLESILNCETPELLLFEILNEYGFNSKLISGINESLRGISGKLFSSENYELLKDRDYLILIKKIKGSNTETLIDNAMMELQNPMHFKFQDVKSFFPKEKPNVAYIDKEKLTYPLKLRYWKHGDKFKPIGMTGFKKLSDLFVDIKLNHFEKTDVLILENGNNEIIWVVNIRLDDRYKITDKTKNILRVECLG